jgi:phosphate uptake regulator
MFFKHLYEALKAKDAISEMISQFVEMLEIGRWMFAKSCAVVEKRVPASEVREELFERDRLINKLERTIREQIVVHLVTGHEGDIGMCLVLMSIVKDAERIGDYCKNVFLVGTQFKGRYQRAEYAVPLRTLETQIADLFPRVQEAFSQTKETEARLVAEDSSVLRKQCDLLMQQLLTPGGSATPDEAAALVIRARFLKRISAHLGNIATSVGNPVPMLDYRGKKPLDEPEE